MRILNVVGARPNFMKISPIIDALGARSVIMRSSGEGDIRQFLVHTGQHYDKHMSELFFDQLGIPSPDINLEVGSASHAVQTAQIMTRFEAVCLEQAPTHVLVVGDVNSTIACSLVAAKLGIAVAHVEAGLRSFDRSMPEEINRILTDAISDYLFTTEQSANENLNREGIPAGKVHFVGNVMIDTLLKHREKAKTSPILEQLGLKKGDSLAIPYGVLTLHRPGVVDDRQTLTELLDAMMQIARDLPLVFPVHPRTRSRIHAFGLGGLLNWGDLGSPPPSSAPGMILAIEPLGYLDFLKLMADSRIVLTDSGGIQEETTILGVPCVTLRNSTERPITVTDGTNVLGGTRREDVLACASLQLNRYDPKMANAGQSDKGSCHPPLWDGKAAERIVEVLVRDGTGPR